MKKIAFFLVSLAMLSACNNTTNQEEEKIETENTEITVDYQYYGDTISQDGAIEASELYAMLEGKDSVMVKVKGVVNQSCKVKGCWMKMDVGDGQEMRVSFKDYGFFVPTNLAGETATIEGIAKITTTSVEDLKHFAQDGGQSEEEIAAITEPEVSISYVATGVIIE
tara:strand:- start:351 stop:851 length:501 start_codon:yes stop_codon:yes gene_type:complete